jgi:biopolymer transport protein ExbB
MTTAAEATAVATKQFGLMQALEEGGPISWAIFLTMVVMSAVSWYIMFTKLIEQGKVIKQGSEGTRKFWTSTSVKDGLNKFEKDTAYRQLVEDALLADDQHGKLIDAQDQHEWLQSSMQRSQAAINSKLSSGLAFLATVGSTSPFVGLLGTVIGIYNALIKIGATGDASIDKVAGPVGEALIMTAIGLVVAVPAVMGYNWLQRRNKLIAEQMSTFCSDLHGYMTSNGAVRPTTKAAAPAAAKPAAAKA